MKKLNRKGFTLIELLAVIVILAVIMAVTVPAVLTSMENSREKMFNTSANTVGEWVEKQYLNAKGMKEKNTSFEGICNNDGNNYCETKVTKTSLDKAAKDFLRGAGVEPSNYKTMSVQVTDGRACVVLTPNKDGDFKLDEKKIAYSVGCPEDVVHPAPAPTPIPAPGP